MSIPTAAPSHTIPAIMPMVKLFSGEETILSGTFFFSMNQNKAVITTIAKRGISSAQNLQTAPFDESGIGRKPASNAQPMKNKSDLPIVISNFFIEIYNLSDVSSKNQSID